VQITAARQTLAGSPCRRSPGEKEDGEEGTIVGSEGGDASEVRTTRPLLCGRRRRGTVEHEQAKEGDREYDPKLESKEKTR